MTFSREDRWVWDFWFAQHEGRHHLFHLQAPRTLSPELRHHNASIGHAVSDDLKSWQELPDALLPGAPGSWDDLATWTGSVIDHDGRWYMLYTGINRAEEGLIQRIGLAVSDDLIRWEKHPGNPVLEADPRWYESLNLNRWRDQSWRDPWLFRHPDDEYIHALITARSPLGEPDGAGVIGHARSLDMISWEVLPPVSEPGDFAQVEVAQLSQLDGSYVILVSCLAEDHSRQRVERLGIAGETGTFVLSSSDMLGPYAPDSEPIASSSGRLGALYAGKLIAGQDGQLKFMAFRGDGDRDFIGELTDPLPVIRTSDGRLRVESLTVTRDAGATMTTTHSGPQEKK